MTAQKRTRPERPPKTDPWPELFDALCTIEATRMRAERMQRKKGQQTGRDNNTETKRRG